MREDLKKIVEDNWEDIQALIIEKVEAEQKSKSIWDLNIGDDKYCRLDWSGDIEQRYFNGYFDNNARDIGNAFLTKEEAEFERERRKIEAIMRKYSSPFAKKEKNYYIYYDYDFDRVVVAIYYSVSDGIPYFKSEEIAKKVIDEIGGDRLKKYWFGIADDER